MTVDELQRWASIFRWVGLSVTGIGLLITFGSYYIADKLQARQREDKLSAQKRLKESEAELQATKAKTAELEKRLAPRQLTTAQRRDFIAALANSPKGPLTIAYVSPQPESTAFVTQIRDLVTDAGFTVPAPSEYSLAYTIDAPSPWHIAIVAHPSSQPLYALPIQEAFKKIGIDAIATDGTQISQPGELRIYVGSK